MKDTVYEELLSFESGKKYVDVFHRNSTLPESARGSTAQADLTSSTIGSARLY